MPRMPKCRKICAFPDYYGFVPEDADKSKLETIKMSLDEYEVIKLLDYEGLNQEECAGRMGVARTTVTAIYDSARKKLSCAIIEGRRLCISGGNIEIDRGRSFYKLDIGSKGENTMRVAVTYDNGSVFGHFGKTEHFKIYDIVDGKVAESKVVDTNGTGHGALAGFLKAAEVEVLICGGIGGGARTALSEAGIELYAGAEGDTDAVIASFIAGSLEKNGDATCDHHDHEHGEGHHCGNHEHGEGHHCGNHEHGGCNH
ncbi:MAG: DUF134 domain-containing protein [Butyrivibrio sp.]|nr:DUF134 domain-containing protein [Butyrivibrio sp.]